MNPLKLKVLEDIIKHLSSSQGMDLKGLLDESKKPPEMGEMDELGKPKGLAIEKVSILGKKNPMEGSPEEEKLESPMDEKSEMTGGEPEMSDSEMEEMLKKYLA